MMDIFDLTGQVAIITGGAGFLGIQHAEAIRMAGGVAIQADIISGDRIWPVDITNPESIKTLLAEVLDMYGGIDILINNAANNSKLGSAESRLESFPLEQWEKDLAVGLTGTFLCSKIIGRYMARHRHGVIVNIASDLALIGPDQRIYRKEEGFLESEQPVKPITYSVIKSGILGLTRYLATYWAEYGIRVNSISPGGMYNKQPHEFVEKLTNLIPMGRMAGVNEYQGAIIFLCSDASSYMTGANLVVDGGRTCW
jgi:NAD(P)-dependent dehydrogenase (short-subunit alcohol dehydrogenase family)